MFKKTIISILLCSILCTFSAFALTQEEKDAQIAEYQDQILEIIAYKNKLHDIAELSRELGLSDNAAQMSELWHEKNKEQANVQDQLDQLLATPVLHYQEWQYAQYPYACQVWQILRENGYNEYVAAGILGNMMCECGGHTLRLQPFLYSHGYYGLCMWSLHYGAAVGGRDIQGQMDYLFGNIQKNMNYFGGSGCYNTFMSLQNEQTAARYFQQYYERGSGSSVRQTNATKALNYFRQA